MEFCGKVAIVTGGAQGIGLEICTRLLKEGMKVCMCDVQQKPVEYFESLSNTNKNNIIFQKCDVTSVDDLKCAFDKTLQCFGRIDLIMNNAGILNESNWRKCIDVNFIGVINGIQMGLQYMGIDKGGRGGYIINTGSVASLLPFDIGPVYCATKHAVVGLTKSYGTDYHFEKTGVKVACVCPGAVDTPLFHVYPDLTLDAEEGRMKQSITTCITPADIAEGVVKLMIDGQNGAILRVDEKGAYYA